MRKTDPTRRRLLQVTGASAVGLPGLAAGRRSTADRARPDSEDYGLVLGELAGTGTAEDPYVVTDASELQAMADEPDAHYRLDGDIDAATTADWNGGAGFAPIDGFAGTLDGRDHEIRELTIRRDDEGDVGLFASFEGSVRDLSLVDATIQGGDQTGVLAGSGEALEMHGVSASGTVRGRDHVGGLVGFVGARTGDGVNTSIEECRSECDVGGREAVGGLLGRIRGSAAAFGSIQNCVATGPVDGDHWVGGLVGDVEAVFEERGVALRDCEASGPVSASNTDGGQVGGLVGSLDNSVVTGSFATGAVEASDATIVGGLVGEARDPAAQIQASYATGAVDGGMTVGGLVGHAVYATVRESYATGDVTGEASVGGLAGEAREVTLTDDYARGAVTGQTAVGGIAGQHRAVFGSSTLERTYATGTVSGDEDVGAITGEIEDTTSSACYWDVETTGQDTSPGLPDENGVPTADLQGATAASTLEEFDFETVWTAVEGNYPELQSVRASADKTVDAPGLQNPRLVQTVENTRAFTTDNDHIVRFGPVAEELLLGDDDPAVAWSALEPDFVAGRRVAPVFDLNVPDPAAVDSPVTVTGRLVDDGTTVREKSARLSPDAVAGRSDVRRDELESLFGIETADQLPFLEVLAADGDHIEGEYPALPAAPGLDFELAIEGSALAEPIEVTATIDDDRVVPAPTLTVGLVGLEGTRIDLDPRYTFGDDADFGSFAEAVARRLIDTYPVSTVETITLEDPHPGFAGLFDATNAAARADRALRRTSRASNQTARYTVGGGRETGVSVGLVDITIGIVPDSFFGGSTQGTLPTIAGRPYANAVLVEYGRPRVAAHELGHYFLGGEFFDDPALARGGDEPRHATDRLRSTGYDMQRGGFDVLHARPSTMSYGSDRWIDAYSYQELIDGGFDPAVATYQGAFLGFLGDTLGRVRDFSRWLDSLPGEVYDAVTEGLSEGRDRIEDRLEDLEDELEDLLEDVEYWQVPTAGDLDLSNRLERLGNDLETVGDRLRDGSDDFLEAAGETTASLGERFLDGAGDLHDGAETLGDRAEEELEDAIEYFLFVDGRTGEGDRTVDAEVLPRIEAPPDLDGDATLTVYDTSNEPVESASATTQLELVSAEGETAPIEGAVAGAVRLPDTATAVEITGVEDTADSRSLAIDPTTHPIRRRIDALPERAILEPDGRTRLLNSLDAVGQHVRDGDTQAAASTLEDLYRSVTAVVDAGYTPRSDEEPAFDELLARIGQQIQRFGGEVPDAVRAARAEDDGIPTTWLLGGAAALVAAGYLFTNVFDDGNDRPPAEPP